MSRIERKAALPGGHPLDTLAANRPETTPEATPAAAEPAPVASQPAASTARPAAAPASSPKQQPYAGSEQINFRASGDLRTHLRITVAGMTLATGEKWSQDRIIRNAIAAYLDDLGREHNDGKPFHER